MILTTALKWPHRTYHFARLSGQRRARYHVFTRIPSFKQHFCQSVDRAKGAVRRHDGLMFLSST